MRLTNRPQQHQGIGCGYQAEALEHELWRVNWRHQGYPYCGIYAISPDNRWPTKIGISQNPTKRLVSLQGACWRRLDIVEYRYCADFNSARLVEKKAHEILKEEGKLLNGEWFDTKPDKALDVIEFAALGVGIELRKEIPDERVRLAILEYVRGVNREGNILVADDDE
jgi:hypothetical protein